MYDYLLGGKDNFAADRAVGDRIIASLPAAQIGVRAQRQVLARVVRYLEEGFALEFTHPQDPETLEESVSMR